jgi:uncharacterized membrane protein YjdF
VPPSDKIIVFLSECVDLIIICARCHYKSRLCVRAVHSHESIIFLFAIVCLAGEHHTFMRVSEDKMQMRIKKLRFKCRALTGLPTYNFLYLQRSLCCVEAAAKSVIAMCVRRYVALRSTN